MTRSVVLKNVAKSFIGFLTVLALESHAVTYSHTGTVTDILISPSFGECAVALKDFPAPGSCGTKWLSLDCAGNFISKSRGKAQMEAVQMAYALETPIKVWFDDNQIANGRCVVYQTLLSK